VEWVVSSYLLTLAALLLVGGRLADVYGRRRLLLLGLAVFTLSSLAAAAPSGQSTAVGELATTDELAADLMVDGQLALSASRTSGPE
jgi:MFS family permease